MRISILLFCFSACVLSAGTITTTAVPFDLITPGAAGSPNPLTGTLDGQLPQFDPSLGTLTSVTAILNITVDMNLHAMLPPSQGTASVFGDFAAGSLWTLPGFGQFDSPFIEDPLGCTAPGAEFNNGCSAQSPVSLTLPTQTTPLSPNTDLNAYIGSSTVLFVLQSQGSVTLISSSPTLTNFSDNLFFDSTEITGNIALQYTYNASDPAPEPGSLGLLGGGLAMLGWMRWRRVVLRLLRYA
jgi:hypothetical protein